MRSVLLLLVGLGVIAPTFPSYSQSKGAPVAPAMTQSQKAEALDKLFEELRRERKEIAAERIASRIRDNWLDSGSASIDAMMQWSQEAIESKKYGVALDFLDRVTVLQPDYSEGWNRRATVHFLMNNYRKSMADIDRTLRLEPRHFGALSGMGSILKQSGRKQLALDAYERALAIYPMMRSAQKEVAELSEELAGEGI
jgi:tetratricopeptide (TPR) repeat protein